MNDSYTEQLIQKLPATEQAAARAAFKAISETGDDSSIAKLLVVLRANNEYAASIPKEMVTAGEKLLRDFDARLAQQTKQQAEAEAEREKHLHEVISSQVPQLGKQLALDRVASGVEAQTAELNRINRSLSRLRHLRVSGLLLLMGLSVAVGAGSVVGLYWKSYHEAERALNFVSRFSDAGVGLSIKGLEGGGVHITLEGPPVLRGTTWRNDADKHTIGADFYFPAGGAE
ncbi:MAG: hypothetical protein QM790_18885 [Nibricoccus sp.]